jgi:hypothetical protein
MKGDRKARIAGSTIIISGLLLLSFFIWLLTAHSESQTVVDEVCAFPMAVIMCIGVIVLGVAVFKNKPLMAMLHPELPGNKDMKIYNDDDNKESEKEL